MAFRTAQSAMLPSLTQTPRELASANVLTSAIESGGVFVGPALGALLLALGGVTTVFLAGALLFAAPAAALLGVAPRTLARSVAHAERIETGLRAIARHGTVRLILGLLLAQTFVSGGLTVLYALVALELLGLGESGIGVLTAAFGLGGVLGSLGTFALAGTRRLVAVLSAGLVLWGLPLVLIGLTGALVPALVLLAAVGIGNVLFDVASVTLLQRAVPDEVLARVFGALETVVVVGLGLGSLAAPVLVDALEVDGALVAFGLLLPALAALCAAALRRVDRSAQVPELELGVLRRLPLFAGLPTPVLENLAFRAEQVPVAAGTTVITEGDVGDRFYAVARGRLRVTIDGVHVRTLGPGDGFGEIALLRDTPRTATVVADDDALLVALERAPFVAAVSGDPGAHASANAIVATRMSVGISRRAV
jgi:MFS family permease